MSGGYTTPKYQLNDAQSIQRLIQSITFNIQKIAQNVSLIENMNMQIGTSKDSESLREKLLQTENHTNQLAKETNKQLKELNSHVRSSASHNLNSEEKQYKIQKERLTNDLVKTLNKFQEVQKLTMQKQRESNERARANMNFNMSNDESMIRMQTIGSSDTDEQMGTFQNSNKLADFGDDLFGSSSEQQLRRQQQQQQQQAQISMENDVNLTQLREREAALRKLESDITDVNTIFKDLAVMVHDQGEIIDSIESNVEQVHVRVSEANNHLESARKNQQKARKKKFIFVSILAGVVAIFLIILILSLHPWSS